jgi:hypothetical protein
MKLLTALLAAWLLLAMPSAARAQASQPLPRVVELKAFFGSHFAATELRIFAYPGLITEYMNLHRWS